MELKDKFDSSILERIKEEKIKPKARWTFLMRDYVIWALGFVSLIIGSLAVAVLIYLIRNNDWSIYEEISGSLLEFAILTLPYYWILFLIVFIVVINYNIRHTKNGYKYSMPVIISSSILASLFLGVAFSSAGLGRVIDDVFAENIVYYEKFMNPILSVWDKPRDGRLTGIMIAKVGDCQYRLIDIHRHEWLIDFVEEKTMNCPLVKELNLGRPIKLLGRQDDDFYFVVDKVFNNNGPGREFMKRRAKEIMDRHPEMKAEFEHMHELRLRVNKYLEMQESSSSLRMMR